MTWLRELSESHKAISAQDLRDRIRCDGQVECYYCRFLVAGTKTNGKYEAAVFDVKNLNAFWHDRNEILLVVSKMSDLEFETKGRALSWAKQEVDKKAKA